jgi:Icc-related predicted phosphoesterase
VQDVITVAAAGDLHCSPPLRDHVLRAFAAVEDVDLILLAGDLTTRGEPEQADVLAEACATAKAPVLAVLGNHDYHSGLGDQVASILRAAGATVLCREATILEIRGQEIGVVGTKGFVGGFEGAEIPDFGEPLLRAVYAETTAEAEAIERGLESISGCHRRIVLLHYAPIRETLHGEPEAIWAFLGCGRLAGPIGAHRPDLVLHGHAHRGSPAGSIGEVPVRNVAIHVTGEDFTRFEL